jgi:hypothetical protein
MPVACPLAARRQDGQAEGEAIGSVALASDRAGRAWDCGGERRELGRPAGCVAERLAVRCGPTYPEPGLPAFTFPQGGATLQSGVGSGTTGTQGTQGSSGTGTPGSTPASAATLADYQQYVGSYYGANEQCVSLTRDFDSSLPPSSQWQQGELVEARRILLRERRSRRSTLMAPTVRRTVRGRIRRQSYRHLSWAGRERRSDSRSWSGSGGASIHTIPWSSWGGNTAEAGSHFIQSSERSVMRKALSF